MDKGKLVITRTEMAALIRALQIGLSTPGALPLSESEQHHAEQGSAKMAQFLFAEGVEIQEVDHGNV